ncbi:MAG TPA: redoxin domain-containing protein [Chitinophagaceae bacterium]|nr:redoxin domain-containing protein [Chitinophagaceae bacterium]
MKYLLNLLIVIGLSKGGWTQPSKTIPAFQFTTLDGLVFKQTDLPAGKMTFFIYMETDCEHCQRAVEYVNRHYQEFKKVSVYLVSMNSPARINQFINQFGKTLARQKNVVVLQDTRYDFISQFKPWKSPGMFLYSVDKKLLLYGDNEKKISEFIKRIKA